jgi:hypothetical protein
MQKTPKSIRLHEKNKLWQKKKPQNNKNLKTA